MTKRFRDEQGRQIVQVRYYGQTGQTGRRGYTYAVDPLLGDLDLKDYVWTPGTYVAPWGQVAAVIDLGSEYTGEMNVITQKISKGYEPQTVTVQRYDGRRPAQKDRVPGVRNDYVRPHP